MAKVIIVFWSGSGNTEKMASSIADGAKAAGSEVVVKNVADASVSELANYDYVAFGSPAMGAEVIEESEMEPFFSEAIKNLSGKKVAVFGSYDWGDGEWLRTWADRVTEGGAVLVGSVKANLTPDDAAVKECEELG